MQPDQRSRGTFRSNFRGRGSMGQLRHPETGRALRVLVESEPHVGRAARGDCSRQTVSRISDKFGRERRHERAAESNFAAAVAAAVV